MNRTIVVTGAASGINAAVVKRLRNQGHRVIGADLRDTDIVCDLSSLEGRAHLVAEVERLAPGGIDGVVAGAGVAVIEDAGFIVRVNYFGAIATLEGLHPALKKSKTPRALVITSTASLLETSKGTVAACLAGDEPRAIGAARASPQTAYASSKYALSRWVRRTAINPRWAGAGIALNGVAPGGVYTPMLPQFQEGDPVWSVLTNTTPRATNDYAQPEALAEVIAWLMLAESGYLLGQILYVDGGTEAILQPDLV